MSLLGVAFDLDGVLVDSEDHKAASHIAVIAGFGGRIAVSDYANVLGESANFVAARMMEIAGVDRPLDEYLARFEGDYAMRLRAVSARPGAVELLALLAARGIKVGVATSSTRPALDELLARCELAPYVSVHVAADDVAAAKPSPNCYLSVMAQLKVAPRNTVVVEDTEVGVSAGKAAGVAVVAVRHGLNRAMRFERAHAVVDSLEPAVRLVRVCERVLRDE